MLKFLLISDHDCVLRTTKVAVETVCPRLPIELIASQFKLDVEIGEQHRLAEFDRVAGLLEAELLAGDAVHDRFIGLVDCPQVDDVGGLHALTSLVGNLILAFPEIQWIALYKDATLLTETPGRMCLKTAIKLCQGGYSPLFDGDGLRGILLSRVHGHTPE
ncbi:MAG: hypothetical protein IKO40_05355, partial [Kiritimatiellae bacterium]|nr:hypothetical protein [Kiritimatiellia bacterium]